MARGHGKKSGKGRKAAAPSWRDVWNVLGNPAGGDCGLHTMLQQLLMMKRGMSATEAVEATRLAAGTPEMRELLMACRRRVVDYLRSSPDFALVFTDGVGAEGDTEENLFTTRELKSLAEWEEAILGEGSYVDGIAILVLGRIFGIPVRVVREVPGGGLENCFDRPDPVEVTDHVATVLHSGGNHFEAIVPIAHDTGIKVSAGNDPGSAMEFCRQALNRPADDPVDDGALVDAVISFVRRIPRRTGPEQRVHKTHRIRKWSRGRTPLTRGRVSRFRDICRGLRSIRGGGDGDDSAVPVIAGAPAAPVDAGLPPAAPGGWDNMQPQVAPTAPVAPVDAGLPPAAPGGWDDMHPRVAPVAPAAPATPVDAGLPPAAPEGLDNIQPPAAPVAPAAPVDAGLPPVAPGGWDDMQPQVAHGTSGLVLGGANQGGGKVCVRWLLS